jgi:hypothetical protein
LENSFSKRLKLGNRLSDGMAKIWNKFEIHFLEIQFRKLPISGVGGIKVNRPIELGISSCYITGLPDFSWCIIPKPGKMVLRRFKRRYIKQRLIEQRYIEKPINKNISNEDISKIYQKEPNLT